MKTKDRILNGTIESYVDELKERIISLWVVVVTMGIAIIMICNLPNKEKELIQKNAIDKAYNQRLLIAVDILQNYIDSVQPKSLK